MLKPLNLPLHTRLFSGILAFALPVPAIIARFQKEQEAATNARNIFQCIDSMP